MASWYQSRHLDLNMLISYSPYSLGFNFLFIHLFIRKIDGLANSNSSC